MSKRAKLSLREIFLPSSEVQAVLPAEREFAITIKFQEHWNRLCQGSSEPGARWWRTYKGIKCEKPPGGVRRKTSPAVRPLVRSLLPFLSPSNTRKTLARVSSPFPLYLASSLVVRIWPGSRKSSFELLARVWFIRVFRHPACQPIFGPPGPSRVDSSP